MSSDSLSYPTNIQLLAQKIKKEANADILEIWDLLEK